MRPHPPDIMLRTAERRLDDECFADVLSHGELARARQFGSARRRKSFTLGRITLRELLGERLDVDPQHVPLLIADDGAIEVGIEGLHASLAHTSVPPDLGRKRRRDRLSREVPIAVAGIAERPIGVDVEAFKPRHPLLYERILGPSEYELIERFEGSPERAVVVLWSLKEAVLKAERCGFRVSPRDLHLDLDVPGRTGHGRMDGRSTWQLRWDEKEAFVVALAFAG